MRKINKEYHKEYNKKYYQANRERLKERSIIYTRNNNHVRKAYYRKNRAIIKEKSRQYYSEHTEEKKECMKQYYKKTTVKKFCKNKDCRKIICVRLDQKTKTCKYCKTKMKVIETLSKGTKGNSSGIRLQIIGNAVSKYAKLDEVFAFVEKHPKTIVSSISVGIGASAYKVRNCLSKLLDDCRIEFELYGGCKLYSAVNSRGD
jgi:hypothetical protein